MLTLQKHFSSMEETMQTLLQSQDTLDGPSVEGTLDLMKAYKDKLMEEMWKQQDSLEGPAAPIEGPVSPRPTPRDEDNVDDTRPLLERLRALEAENSALSMENDNQRKQYERCLDEVANQVVQALLTQKDLKEECVKLRTRVFDLEQQNRILSVLFQQRAKTTNTVALAQEVQRNGKANVPTGRWPSLLSLTCPRSSCSGSGSDASLSSACSEYSSGSHTWAEGHGSSKQSATSREKRMSAGSVSANPTVACDNGELAWKEGHILKGLKRLQMRSPKKPPSLPSVSHCKDCMTSNEGIYSHGVMGGPQVTVPKQAVTVGHEPFKAGAGVVALISDSDDGDEDSLKFQTGNTYDQPLEEALGLEDPSTTPSGEVEKDFPKKLTGNHGHFLLPLPDEFLLEGLTLKPCVSPTESPNHMNTQKNSLDKVSQTCLKKVNDRNNNQKKATDRKSRLDYDKRKQDRFFHKQLGKGLIEGGTPIQHSAKKALSCVSEARQRSSSMDTHCRDHSTAGGDSQDYIILESPQRKIKPQACDSAKRAFILRSKSADGGSEQTKQLHSPLHQKLIKIHRSKGQSKPVHSTSDLSKNDSSIQVPFHKVEKVENPAVGQVSPLSSPVKHSHTFKPNEAPNSPTETPLQNNILSPNSDSFTESPISNNVLTSPMKQLYLEQYAKVSHSEPHSLSPPPPPDRTISLLIRPVCESSPKANKPTCQSPTSSPGKDITSTSKHQPSMATKCTDNIITHISSDLQSPKCVPTEVDLESSTSLPGQESHASDSPQSSLAVANHEGTCTSIQVSSDPIHFDVPQASTDIHFHGFGNLYQNSNPRATKTAPSVNAKSVDAIPNPGQGNNTLLILENKGNANASTKCLQTFAHAHQMIHEGNETGAKDKVRRKSETLCSSLDSEASVQPAVEASGVMLDWGFDEEGWLFKRSVSVSTRPPLKPVMGRNGAKARSQSFGAWYMDKPSFNRSGKVRTQIKTHSGSSLNSLSDVFPGSMSCSSSYHCPMNRSLLSNFLIEEGLPIPSHLASSSERLQNLKQHREQARRLQIEQQFSSAFGEPVSEEPEQQNTITTIEEKVMLGIEENLHKSQEQERTNEAKQKSSSSFASWFGFRKSKLAAPSSKKVDSPKVKEEKREQKITSLLGGKQIKCDKKKDRRKSDGKDSSAGRREAHDAVRACISMPCPGMSLNEMQGHTDVCCGDPKMQMINRSADGVNGCSAKSPSQEPVSGSGCRMRTLDSGIGTIPLPESCSFFSSILHLLPKSTSTPDPSLSPPSGGGSSSEDVSPSPLPRWKIPLGSKDHGHSGIPTSLSDCPMTQSVPFPAVAFLHSVQPKSGPGVTSVCDTQSKLPRLAPGGVEPKKLTYVQSKPRATPSQQKEKRMK